MRAQAAISYADLDISRTPGAQALLERIKATAQKLCRPALDANNGSALPYRTCLRTAVENAVLAVDSPLLHSLYGGEPVTVARSE
ncbi:MAG: UrcA family protein [Rhizomicrobium sp.]